MPYNFDFQYRESESSWEVSVDTKAKYGFFEYVGEREDRYVEGGLWFESIEGRTEPTLALVDYDGVADLPFAVRNILTRAGFDLSRL